MVDSDNVETSNSTGNNQSAEGVGEEPPQQAQDQPEPHLNHQPNQAESPEQPDQNQTQQSVPREEDVDEEPDMDDGEEDLSADSNCRESATPTNPSPPAIASLTNRTHPLKCRWTMWFLNSNKNMDWLQRLKAVCTIASVEEFWALYDSIRPPSVLFGSDYNLFKENIKPIWEVPENKNGGRLVVMVDKARQHELLDQLWLELLIALIGDQFGGDTDEICGAVCNIRQKGSKISLWTRDNRNDEAHRRIGSIMKGKFMSLVGNKANLRVVYEDHSDVQIKSSSSINARLVI